jgi:isoleucyl-tRNA synthetase
VWTTTPWTLISNAAVAVGPDIDYVTVEVDGERVILAEDLLTEVLGEDGYRVISRTKGQNLEGKRYRRPFDYVPVERAEGYENLWTVVLGDYVTTTEGTGLVHTAPAYGEDDARTGRRYGLPTIHPVRPDGTFDERVGPFARQFVKDADPGLVEELREKGLLFRVEVLEHAYPHCWRCGTPLLLREEGLVRADHRGARRASLGEREDQLGPRAHKVGALRRLAKEQHRLGLEPRALLGHAAPDLAHRFRRYGRGR